MRQLDCAQHGVPAAAQRVNDVVVRAGLTLGELTLGKVLTNQMWVSNWSTNLGQRYFVILELLQRTSRDENLLFRQIFA